MKLNNEQFNILRKISRESNVSQRKMAKDLGYSLGKVNYCLEALKEKGLIKMSNLFPEASKGGRQWKKENDSNNKVSNNNNLYVPKYCISIRNYTK